MGKNKNLHFKKIPPVRLSIKMTLVVCCIFVLGYFALDNYKKLNLAKDIHQASCVEGLITEMTVHSPVTPTRGSGIDLSLQTTEPHRFFEVIDIPYANKFKDEFLNYPKPLSIPVTICYLKKYPDVVTGLYYAGVSVEDSFSLVNDERKTFSLQIVIIFVLMFFGWILLTGKNKLKN